MKPTTHRRNTGSFGFGLKALCGAKGGKMVTNPKYVDCAECIELIKSQRAAAKARMVAL